MDIKGSSRVRHGFTYWKRNRVTWTKGFYTGRHKMSYDSHITSLAGVGGRSFREHENVDHDCGFKGKTKPVHREIQCLSAYSPLPLSCGMCSKSEIMSCLGTLRPVHRGICFFFKSQKPFAPLISLSMENIWANQKRRSYPALGRFSSSRHCTQLGVRRILRQVRVIDDTYAPFEYAFQSLGR